MSVLVFGCGYLGSAFARRMLAEERRVTATARTDERRKACAALGVATVDPADRDALAAALEVVEIILVTAPPDEDGCPGLRGLVPALARAGAFPGWIGYVSSTGVYGDRDGGWVFEHSELNAATVQAARRAAAERDWFEVGRGMGLTVCAFRLPAVYGPGRSPFAKIRDGSARRVRKPGQVFNRIHVDDAVEGLVASIARPGPARPTICATMRPPGGTPLSNTPQACWAPRPRPRPIGWTLRSATPCAASIWTTSGYRTRSPRPNLAGGPATLTGATG